MRKSLAAGDIPRFCSDYSASCPLVLEMGVQDGRAPMISIHPSSLESSHVKKVEDAIQGMAVWNRGGGVLSYSIATDADWLYCDPADGVSTGQSQPIKVHTSPSSLKPGKYVGVITVSAPGAVNSPQSIEVTLKVTQPPHRIRRNIKRLFRIKSRR